MTSIYANSRCTIQSNLPKEGEYFSFTDSGDFDELVVQDYLAVKKAINSAINTRDHSNLEKRVKTLPDINALFYEGDNTYTLLHEAVRIGCAYCTQILLQHGAKVDIIDKAGKTAEMLTSEYPNLTIDHLINKRKNAIEQDNLHSSYLLLETKVECLLTRKGSILEDFRGGEIWVESFEGSLSFIDNGIFSASVYYSRMVEKESYDDVNMTFKVTKLLHYGNNAYKIDYDKSSGEHLKLIASDERYQQIQEGLFIDNK